MVVLQVEVGRISELVRVASLLALVWVCLAILPRHVLAAPVRSLRIIIAISASVRDPEDSANSWSWRPSLGRAARGAEPVALTTVRRAPTLVRVVIQACAVHCCGVLRQSPEVAVDVPSPATATRAPRGVLIPGRARTELPVLHGRTAGAFGLQRNAMACTSSRRAARNRADDGDIVCRWRRWWRWWRRGRIVPASA